MALSISRAGFGFLSGLLWLWLSIFPFTEALGKTDTITWGGSNDRAGYQINHNMDPAIVGSAQFGLLFRTLLPGTFAVNGQNVPEQIFAQPLVYTGSDDVQYVYIATTQNNIYKMNAKTGAIVASRNLHRPFLVTDLDGCTDINPIVGITATGVIDPSTDTWYLTSKTYADQNSNGPRGKPNGRYYFHAINTNDLSERANFPVDLEAVVARNNPDRVFTAGIHHQRPGLLQHGQFIYAGFASHCAQYNFTGWIFGWDKTSGRLVEQFATEGAGVASSVPGAGVWMSGGGLTSDDKGSMFFSTGNGYASQAGGPTGSYPENPPLVTDADLTVLSNIPVNGRNPPTALEEAAVHMAINTDGSIRVVDFFMPWEKQALDGADKDLGTTPLELLPSEFSCGNIKRIGIVTGKSGKTYWIDMDNMGGYRNGPGQLDNVIQVYQNENSVYAGAGVYPLEGGYSVIQYPTHVFKFSCDNGAPSFNYMADSPENNAYVLGVGHGTTTSLDGQSGTGLLWTSDMEGANLRIYDAVPVNSKLRLRNSFVTPGVTKFSRPVFGDGIVYQGTTLGYIYAYGSPVNVPLNCTALQFGIVNINSTSSSVTVQCKASIALTVTAIGLAGNPNFVLSGLPTLPYQVTQGQNLTFLASFTPQSVGPLSSAVILNTTQQTQGFSGNTQVQLRGSGQSQAALFQLAPNTVSFNGFITGQDQIGVNQTVTITNAGNSILQLSAIQFSTTSETGPWVTPNGTASARSVGAFTFYNFPTSILANTGMTIPIHFNPSRSGSFAAFVKFTSNGGSKLLNVLATGNDVPKAIIEFELPGGGWAPFSNSTAFSFGNVTQNTSRYLRLRITNAGGQNAAALSLTVSKSPFGIPGSIIGASNQVDLGEGTLISAGQNATATLYCSAPKSQINVDTYNGTAVWAMNMNDPSFGRQSLRFICNAVSEQTGPRDPSVDRAAYRYAGCYKENDPNRQLQTQIYSSDTSNTNDICIAQCAAKGFIFAGTQYRSQCWCGYNRPKTLVDDANCNFACSGNNNQVCGGNGLSGNGAFLSTFGDISRWNGNMTDSPGPYINPGAFGFKSLGCYAEGTNVRALSVGPNSDNTVRGCLSACSGYVYAGVEYGGQCFCGQSLGTGSVSAPSSECSMVCNNNQTEYCGGPNRLNMYSISEASSSTMSKIATSISSTTSLSASLVIATTTATASGPPIPAATAGNFRYLDCFTEPPDSRALVDKASANNVMTTDLCASLCTGFTFMATEYSSECFCGNVLQPGSVKATDGRCSMTCSGNAGTICGGPNGLSLYQFTVQNASSSSSTSTTRTSTVPLSTTSSSATTSIPVTTLVTASGNTTSSLSLSSSTSGSTIMTSFTSSTSTSTRSDNSTIATTTTLSTTSSIMTTLTTSISRSSTEGNSSTSPTSTITIRKTNSGISTSTSIASTSRNSTGISSSSTSASSSVNTTTAPATSPPTASTTTPSTTVTTTTTTASPTTTTASPTTTALTIAASTSAATPSITATSPPSSSISTSSSVTTSTSGTFNSSSSVTTTSSTSNRTSTPPSCCLSSSISSSPTTLTATSSSTSTTPTSITPSPYTPLGCYAEPTSGKRFLSAASTSSPSMTHALCATFCAARSHALFGVEYGRECYCASTLPANAPPALSPNSSSSTAGCNMLCAGSLGNEICGGASRVSVYRNTAVRGPVHKETLEGGYAFMGCYTDVGPRAIQGWAFSSANMSQEMCVGVCRQRGWSVAGAEYAEQCFCGDRVSVSADGRGGVRVAEGECGMRCKGDQGEWCGGGNRLSVWGLA